MGAHLNIKRSYLFEILLILIFFIFSSSLMWKTFQVTPDKDLKISAKVWSDFAATIPLTRSFSLGSNFPLEHPLFPGQAIKYHFLFYLLVGILERMGIRIDYSLNLLSSFSFTFLLFMIYLLGKSFSRKKTVGVLSVFLFLFNGSFSFVEFFKKHPPSISTPVDILKNTSFPSFGPYDGNIVSAFWNLNIYTNQRHLALSFALVLYIIYLLFYKNLKSRKTNTIIFLVLSVLVFINKAAFAISLPFIFFFIILKPRKRVLLIISSLSALLVFLASSLLTQDFGEIKIKLGFLMSEPLGLFSFLKYWLYNFGLYLIVIPIGFFSNPKINRKLALPMLALFIGANIFQFSTDIINNHKFFNFFLILGTFFVANLLTVLFNKKSAKGITLGFLLIIFLTLSGLIDYFVIMNDNSYTIKDVSNNPDAYFFWKNTPPKSVVLNSTFLYHPASLAGRKIFYGYPYFTWSYGYDKDGREKILVSIYRARSKNQACSLLLDNNISYVELNDNPENIINPNWELWKNNFTLLYKNPSTKVSIFDVQSSCQNSPLQS